MKLLITSLLIATSINTFAQSLGKGITYSTELSTTASSGDYAPFWLTANHYGLSSIENNSAYLRGGLFRSTDTDSLRKWKLGYGADVAITSNHTSKLIIQQLYGEVTYNKGVLTVGAKQMPLMFKSEELSTGDMTYSINARPIPQIRLALNDYWNLPLTDGWFAFKGHIAYGWFTDGGWQKDYTAGTNLPHSNNVLFHSKSGYIRIGKENILPVTLTAGVHFCAQFGGEAWNMGKRLDDTSDYVGDYAKMNNGPSAYWHAFFPGGRDVSDGGFDNAEGNQLGSYQACIEYKSKEWAAKLYAEHYFDDHSQMFFQYDWKDFLWGLEVTLPHNPVATSIVLEHIGTEDQSGCVYHDHTVNLPTQLSGTDNYYNHSIYGGWQHWGQGIGNPTIISPIYNHDHRIFFYNNRIRAYHIGVSGDPTPDIHYRVLYTHTRSRGTYATPNIDPLTARSILAEATYTPHRLDGWSITGAYATTRGTLLGTSDGGQITIRKKGILTK
ncbi:MAG: hypothetical protein IKQ72_07985 [Bacteroidaceae bacterium]|nr:hypothetical protein [Bacteroidaceae bacterium]